MPRKKKNHRDIPFHKLEQVNAKGFELYRVDEKHLSINVDEKVKRAHRDDHYIFLVLEKGTATFMVDFSLMKIRRHNLFVIQPAQVHHYVSSAKANGWLMAVDVGLVDEIFRPVFEEYFQGIKPVPLLHPQAMLQCLQLLHDIYTEKIPHIYSQYTMRSLVATFVSMAAAAYYTGEAHKANQVSRSIIINRQFRKLVAEKFVAVKNPAAYAALLHISAGYLNEVVKASTGAPASYWIQHEILLEARRLLYHSDLSVKEIACRTGYEDPAYFQRLFKKALQCTPLEFRNRYRELSNTNH